MTLTWLSYKNWYFRARAFARVCVRVVRATAHMHWARALYKSRDVFEWIWLLFIQFSPLYDVNINYTWWLINRTLVLYVCAQNFNASYLWKAIYDCKKPFVCALMSGLFHSMNETIWAHVITKLIDDKNINLSSQRSVNRWMVIKCPTHVLRSISLGVLSLSLSLSLLSALLLFPLPISLFFFFVELLRIVLKSLLL